MGNATDERNSETPSPSGYGHSVSSKHNRFRMVMALSQSCSLKVNLSFNPEMGIWSIPAASRKSKMDGWMAILADNNINNLTINTGGRCTVMLVQLVY